MERHFQSKTYSIEQILNQFIYKYLKYNFKRDTLTPLSEL